MGVLLLIEASSIVSASPGRFARQHSYSLLLNLVVDTPFRHPSTLPRRPKIYITPVQSVQYIHTTVTQRTASWSSHSLSLATFPSPTIEHHIYSTYIFHSYSLK